MKKILLILTLFIAISARGQSWCTSGVVSGSNPSVTAACNQSYSAHSTTVPSGNDSRIYALYYLTSAGASNTNRILLVIHGGVGAGVFGSNQPITTAQAVQLAQNGFNVYMIAYTDVTDVVLCSAITSSSTTLSVDWQAYGSGWVYPTSGSPNWGLYFNDGAGEGVITVTGGTFTQTSSSLCGTPSSLTVTRGSNPASHTANATAAIESTSGGNTIYWPVPANDIAAFLSFLGTCSAGGTVGPGTGTCSSYSTVPGNPKLISLIGFSTGSAYPLTMLLQSPGCVTGSGCSFLNNASGTAGYSEWSASWQINNPGGAVDLVLASAATDIPAVAAADTVLGTSYGPAAKNGAILQNQGVAPVCNDATFSVATLQCQSPGTGWNASTNSNALSILNGWYGQTQAKMPVPALLQTGCTDNMFGPAACPSGTTGCYSTALCSGGNNGPGLDVLLGQFANLRTVYYAGVGHIGSQPSTTVFNDEQAALGVNGCPTTQPSGCPHPTAASGGVGMAGGVR